MDETKVWQRVFAAPELPGDREGLGKLCTEAARNVAACRRLPGPVGQQIRQLQTENLQCLRGLCRLSGVPESKPGSTLPGGDPIKSLWHRCRRSLTEYTARSAQWESGAVFQRLAENEARCLTLLARLLGTQA